MMDSSRFTIEYDKRFNLLRARHSKSRDESNAGYLIGPVETCEYEIGFFIPVSATPDLSMTSPSN